MNLLLEKDNEMNKILTVSIASLFISTAASAGSFDGPYVQIGAGVANNSTQVSENYPAPGYVTADLSKTTAVGQILAGYSYNFTDKFNLAANIYYNFGNDKSGSMSIMGATLDNKLKNVWGISFEPGYYLTENTLGYLKVGYQRGDVSMNINAGGDSASAESTGVSAFMYGFGVKQLLTSNLYIGAEVSRADYSSESLHGTYVGYPGGAIPAEYQPKSEASQTLGLVTLGYKF